ncbi:unnamed protein product [Vitrella brassicaformis CCMP3155]|uniref:Uncharacterized protein n=1 Tax=Vitrella brassicaformis (strain CCMP3155) TaxID=1169540 RepID=A0A0G4H6J6_VITBC|nr:unnamed protein product [Vitrella brassicaformis CCMP3155]|eukprot:CEM39341.1 unnamed protein product [Vitrella brassicaformis CCMP3155]
MPPAVAFLPSHRIMSHQPFHRHLVPSVQPLAQPRQRIFQRVATWRHAEEGQTSGQLVGEALWERLVGEKDLIIDGWLYTYLSTIEKVNAFAIFENFVANALVNSGLQDGWTYENVICTPQLEQIEALGGIINHRSLDQVGDHTLRLMVDTHHKCCKDERHFVDFYQDLSEELAKPEYDLWGICQPIYIRMPQDDLCRAMEIIIGSMGLETSRKDFHGPIDRQMELFEQDRQAKLKRLAEQKI